ncbi:MAG TPA: hypothetical protein DEB70_11525 [Planctomycetaceae bacterium]|nr:hypothetical protein [Planctomycetaceae bacterium]|tara:strand:+ start:672 stop:905 length:234 start_codon:yes stop_codon:yes gene_type:complete
MYFSAHARIGNQKDPPRVQKSVQKALFFRVSNSFYTTNGGPVFSILTARNVAFFESTTVCKVPIAFTTNCGGWYATI